MPHFRIEYSANRASKMVLDPDGHRIEIYCSDYLTVDPDLEPIKWDLKDPQRRVSFSRALKPRLPS